MAEAVQAFEVCGRHYMNLVNPEVVARWREGLWEHLERRAKTLGITFYPTSMCALYKAKKG